MIENFDNKLKQYADVVVKVGLNLQPGQRLILNAPIEQRQLVQYIAEKAYQNGARFVEVLWSDDALTLARYQYAPRDSFSEVPTWRYEARRQFAEAGDATLYLLSNNPMLLENQDPELVDEQQQAAMKASKPFSDLITRNATNWCVISAPFPGWNTQVFPLATNNEEAEEAMWRNLFQLCRLDQPDPVAAWKNHIRDLDKRAAYLNDKRYDRLEYKAPGTDLSIGLPQGQCWFSATAESANGIEFVANLPTEEVFTMPHRDRVNGYVSSTKPLSMGGQTMENFTLTFENGRVVKATAEKGEVQLLQLLETDEGSRYLGEVALVPHSSPISQSGLVFNNGLIDENAACHLALGSAYKFTLENGTSMSDDAFAAAGGNISHLHMDFMIGSGELDIDGVTESGAVEPVMRHGEWAFDA